jgi:murein L,D-transpeptidase YafK
VVVETTARAVFLCEQERSVRRFAAHLGRGGTGKRREGDGKVPLGRYALGTPRPSARFGIFIPIGYPTAEQSALGYTGGAVGMHGPHRWLRWLGRLVNRFASTAGCVGVATDGDIAAIADWVRRSGASGIWIR